VVKCPFCGFENEDGVLFCEQCKSDLSSVPSNPAPAPAEVPMAAIVDDPAELDKTVPIAAPAAPAAEPVDLFPAAASEPPIAFALPVDEGSHASDRLPVAETLTAPVRASDLGIPSPSAAPSAGFALGTQPRLKVMRGLKVGVEFPIYSDYNYIGRADEKPVDIDLEDQEPPDRVWCSRQHAVIHFDEAAGVITLEDLNSSNGTWVNRNRVYPGEKRTLNPNDVVQIGTVHMKLLV
jgi:hypothetical protein